MRKKIELVVLVLLTAGLAVLNKNLEQRVNSGEAEVEKNIVLIDAGHGGSDPGKVGVNDALEKDLNLEIAKKVAKLLKEQKIKVIMTREEDVMLAGEDHTGTKAADMKARVNLINGEMPQIAVSIHQNSYQDPSVCGAQVFYYSGSEDGKNAAQIMQESLLAVDENNKRQAKANDTYYLLRRTKAPTIIVECGFLSNPQEAGKLCLEEYQDKIAEAICKGITEYSQGAKEQKSDAS